MWRVARWCVTWACLSLSLLACSEEEAEQLSHDISYVLTWNTDGVQFEDTGFSLNNNLGVTVHVDAAYLVLYSTQMVACETNGSILGLIYNWLMPSIAHAGHGGENRDPSAMLIPTVEDVSQAERLELGSQTVTDMLYCQIHYLVGRAEENAQFLPLEPDLLGTSLYLSGSWSPAEGADATEFLIETSTAYGALKNLYPQGSFGDESAAYELDMNQTGAEVVIERYLGTMFDNVDWTQMSDTAVERKILANIIEQVQITVTPLDALD